MMVYILYSAYCRKGWGGRVRQNLPPGHANFNRRLFLTTLAIKRSEPFSKLHESRPEPSQHPLSPLDSWLSDHRLALSQCHPDATPTPPQLILRPVPAAHTAPQAAAARAAPGCALAPDSDEQSGSRPPVRRPP